MLVPPRKKSHAVDYAGLLKRFLSNTYSPQEAADNADGIKSLAEMRSQAIAAAEVAYVCRSDEYGSCNASHAAAAALLQYHCHLFFLHHAGDVC